MVELFGQRPPLKLHLWIGWIIGAVCVCIYGITLEPTVGFWDCGEYITTASQLQVGHPPGAPTYQVLASLFSLLSLGNDQWIAPAINLFSAVASGLTISFLYWSLVLLCRKLSTNEVLILCASIIGAFSFAFTDSFWASATETEVYALSSLFTAILFWSILRWEKEAPATSFRWILLIAFLLGLSVGVHFLALLAIPSLVFASALKRNPFSPRLFLKSSLLSLFLLGLVWLTITLILFLPEQIEILSVNLFHFKEGIGLISFFSFTTLFAIGSVFFFHHRKLFVWLKITLCFLFFVIGLSSFLVLVIRANAHTPINEGDPSNLSSLRAYLSREQYGATPLFYGTNYTAFPASTFKSSAPPVVKTFIVQDSSRSTSKTFYSQTEVASFLKANPLWTGPTVRYEKKSEAAKIAPLFEKEFFSFFPRMWSPMHEYGYRNWVGRPQQQIHLANGEIKEKPSFGQNLNFFFSYQLNHMYFRYFLWNFVGRVNDNQGFSFFQDGEWICGFSIIDNLKIGESKNLPNLRKNQAHNTYFFLPFLLGLIGLFYHLKKDKKSFFYTLLLFLFASIAIVVFLNQYAYQARERDYIFTSSFYVFSIWIGIGSLCILQNGLRYLGKYGVGLGFIACLAIPTLLLCQNWDDHNRSGRYTARNFAISMLESCKPNAILFTNGDNDTFPLWYAQEVEGIRQDVRVVNLQLLNLDWYIDGLKRKSHTSEPLPISVSKNKYIGHLRSTNYIRGGTKRIELSDALSFLFDSQNTLEIEGIPIHVLPSNHLQLSPPSQDQSIIPTLEWSLSDYSLSKSDMIVLDILAHNHWERPIHFSSISVNNFYGLDAFLERIGFIFSLNPSTAKSTDLEKFNRINIDETYRVFTEKFEWKNFARDDIYYDAIHRSTIKDFREIAFLLAQALNMHNRPQEASSVLDLATTSISEKAAPYDEWMEQMAYEYAKTEEHDKASTIFANILTQHLEEIDYILSLKNGHRKNARISFLQSCHSLLDIAEFTENMRMETDRMLFSETVFSIMPKTTPYIEELLAYFNEKPSRLVVFSKDVEELLFLAQRFVNFCHAYREKELGKELQEVLTQYSGTL